MTLDGIGAPPDRSIDLAQVSTTIATKYVRQLAAVQATSERDLGDSACLQWVIRCSADLPWLETQRAALWAS